MSEAHRTQYFADGGGGMAPIALGGTPAGTTYDPEGAVGLANAGAVGASGGRGTLAGPFAGRGGPEAATLEGCGSV